MLRTLRNTWRAFLVYNRQDTPSYIQEIANNRVGEYCLIFIYMKLNLLACVGLCVLKEVLVVTSG